MSSTRKNEISLQLFRVLQILKEADLSGAVPSQPQQTPQTVANSNPMQPLPGQGQTQVVGSSGGEPISSTTGEPLSLDIIIDKMNIIRGGKSFSEPEVYGQLTTLYKSLSDQDKITLDRILSEIGKIVIHQGQTTSVAGQSSGTTSAQPPPGRTGNPAIQQPVASPAPTSTTTGTSGVSPS